MPTPTHAPITNVTTSISVACPRGSKRARSSQAAMPPANAAATISIARRPVRLGQRCPSVRCPLHRGHVAIRSGSGNPFTIARRGRAQLFAQNCIGRRLRRRGAAHEQRGPEDRHREREEVRDGEGARDARVDANEFERESKQSGEEEVPPEHGQIADALAAPAYEQDRKSTRLNSSHM